MYKRGLAFLLAAILAFTPVMQVQATEAVPGDLPAASEEQIPGEDESVSEDSSAEPTAEQTEKPTAAAEESVAPSEEPSEEPVESKGPAEEPTAEPEESVAPSEEPSAEPMESAVPDEEQTEEKEAEEVASAELEESAEPTEEPAEEPSETPSFDAPEIPPLNYHDIDVQVDMPKVISPLDDWCYSTTALPAKYDGRTSGKVSSVKTQSPYGTCWAFSAVAMAESAFMRLYGTEANLSEAHLVEFFYNSDDSVTTTTGNITGDYVAPKSDTQEENGGNGHYTTFALASWRGVANETAHESFTYQAAVENGAAVIDSKYAFTDVLHLENAYWIPSTDTDGIKRAVMNYGGVGMSYFYHSVFDDSYVGGSAYYCPEGYTTNHAVTIVGWDDDYSIDNFKNRSGYVSGTYTQLPSSNGAWLIKNSWGSNYHDGGYFWISYEDASLADVGYVFDYAKADDFKYNYQYDGGSYANSYYGIEQPKVGAVYTASGNQEIGAVGVAFDKTNVPYQVKIYTGLTDMTNPESGELQTTQTGLTTYEGFHTIRLDTPAFVAEGESFSVVIESTDGSDLEVMFDRTYTAQDWIDLVADTNAGETFFAYGTRWYDAINYFSNSQITLRIKAFANDANSIRSQMVDPIPDQEYTGAEICPPVTVKIGETTLVEDTDYTVKYANNVNAGKATVTVTGIGNYTGSATAYFNITPKAMTDDMVLTPDKDYDGTAYKNITLSVLECDIAYYKDETPRGTAIDAPVNAGDYVAVVTGKGNYAGSVEKTFKILPLSVEQAQITAQDMIYTKDSYPGITVFLLGVPADSSNYSVKYYKNQTPLASPLTKPPVNAGNYVAVVEGKGNLTGSKTVPFAIMPFVFTEENISAPNMDYNATVYDKVEVRALDEILADTNYSVKYYVDEEPRGEALTKAPAKAGNYIVEVTGKGNYAGTVEKAFRICHLSITEEMIQVSDVDYDGSAYQGLVVAGDAFGLTENVDYEVEFFLNQTPRGEALGAAPTEVGNYLAVVTGKGNYAGSAEKAFAINPYILGDSAVKISDKIYDGQPFTAYSLKALNKTLTEVDYQVTYYLNQELKGEPLTGVPVNSGSYLAVFEGRGNFAGTIEKAFTIKKVSVSKAEVTLLYEADDVISGIKVSLNGSELTADDYTYSYFSKDTDEELTEIPTEIGDYYVKVVGKDNYEGEKIFEFSIHPKWLSSIWFAFEDVVYDGTEKAPIVVLNDELSEEDYAVTYNKAPINAGTYTATVKGIGNYEGTLKYTFKITKRPITETEVSELADYVYNGKAKKPAVTVSIGDVVISKDNYTVTYSKNKNAGTAKAVITGKGNLSGSVEKTFTIAPKSVDGFTVSVKNATFNGKEVAPKVTIKDGKTELVKGKDFTVSYQNATDACEDLSAENAPVAVITGIGNYEGELSKTFKIAPYVVTAKNLTAQLYNDENELTDAVLAVKAGTQELLYGRDYLVTLKDATSGTVVEGGPGAAEVGKKYHLTFSFINNFTSEKASITVKNITCKADIGDCELVFKVGSEYVESRTLIYNGKAQKPAIVVLSDGKPLSAKKYSVSYANNKNVSTDGRKATVTVTGLSGYAGTITAQFEIKPATVFESAVSVKQSNTYTGKAVKPKVTIEGLEEGTKKDFWVIGYENNVNANHEGDEAPTVKVQLSPNFVFNSANDTCEKTFNIKPAKITSMDAVGAYYKGGEEVTTKLTVKAGKITLSPSDYTAVYKNNTAVGTAKVTVSSDKNSGNFYSATSITKSFKITRESLAKVKVKQVKKPVYTGEAIDFSECYDLYDAAGNLIEKSQYTVSPATNIKAGTITVTFKAKSGEGTRFTGKKTVKCKVASAYLGDFLTETEKGLPDKKYNKGKAVTLTKKELDAAFMDKVSGKAIKSTSFTVKYENNKKRGMAKAYLTGKGNYNGTVVVYFRIK